MPRASNNESTKSKKIPKQNRSSPFSSPRLNSNNHGAESRNPIAENSKKRFLFVKFQGLGCKGTSLPASTPEIVRPAPEWEANRARNQSQKRKRIKNRRNQENNVVVDIPDAVCCAPPGIGIASDFTPRPRNIAPRSGHRKHSREARRNGTDFGAFVSSGRGHRTAQTVGEIIEMLMSQQPMLSERILQEHDRHHGWRLDVDTMSYEELLDLSDRIGYVGTGLKEDEILSCLKKFNFGSLYLLMTEQKDWKCSICQEKGKRSDDISSLSCGHHYHTHCIKQWLLFKNACPICKTAAFSKAAATPEPDKSS